MPQYSQYNRRQELYILYCMIIIVAYKYYIIFEKYNKINLYINKYIYKSITKRKNIIKNNT